MPHSKEVAVLCSSEYVVGLVLCIRAMDGWGVFFRGTMARAKSMRQTLVTQVQHGWMGMANTSSKHKPHE